MIEFFDNVWKVMCELSIWLFLGTLVAGALHVFLPPDFSEASSGETWIRFGD